MRYDSQGTLQHGFGLRGGGSHVNDDVVSYLLPGRATSVVRPKHDTDCSLIVLPAISREVYIVVVFCLSGVCCVLPSLYGAKSRMYFFIGEE